jgi:hypothetical protein
MSRKKYCFTQVTKLFLEHVSEKKRKGIEALVLGRG